MATGASRSGRSRRTTTRARLLRSFLVGCKIIKIKIKIKSLAVCQKGLGFGGSMGGTLEEVHGDVHAFPLARNGDGHGTRTSIDAGGSVSPVSQTTGVMILGGEGAYLVGKMTEVSVVASMEWSNCRSLDSSISY
jgi:hypothetical protein